MAAPPTFPDDFSLADNSSSIASRRASAARRRSSSASGITPTPTWPSGPTWSRNQYGAGPPEGVWTLYVYPWKAQAVPGRWRVYPEMAAAGLWTTAGDLARAGLEVGRAARGESSFRPRDLARRMLTRQLPGSDVGIGSFLDGKGASARFGHSGWDQGFCAEATFYVESGEGAVVMLNSNEGQALQGEILRAVAREYGWPDFFPTEKAANSKAPPPPDALLGEYETEKGARFAVRRGEGRLELVAPGQPSLELRPSEEMKFFVPDLNAEVAFKKGEKKGSVDRLVIDHDGVGVEAKRKQP